MITDSPICIIQSGKQKSFDLAKAVIAGCDGKGRIVFGDSDAEYHETPVIIGTHPTTINSLRRFSNEKRPFVVVDNGYLKGYKEGGYFRATTNAMQWISGSGGRIAADELRGSQRLKALDVHIKAWRDAPEDGYLLIALQSRIWYAMMGVDRDKWLLDLISRIKVRTGREIIVRDKPLKGSPPQPELEEQFKNCAGVIAYSSNVMIKAILHGIPVYPQTLCALTAVGNDLSDLDFPRYPFRLPLLHALAANQWTLDEIKSGVMWADLKKSYEPEFYPLS